MLYVVREHQWILKLIGQRPQGWEVEGTAGSSLAFVERRERERELEQQRDLGLPSGLLSQLIGPDLLQAGVTTGRPASGI